MDPLGSPRDTIRETPTLPEGFQVRNTFLEMEKNRVNDRIVQSMPHDMFRNVLMAEMEAAGGASMTAVDTAKPPALPPTQPGLAPGTQVTIEGLIKLPSFNGL